MLDFFPCIPQKKSYHPNSMSVKMSLLTSGSKPTTTAQKALEEQVAMETKFHKKNLKSHTSSQRIDQKIDGSTTNVVQKLEKWMLGLVGDHSKIGFSLSLITTSESFEKSTGKYSRPEFEKIYNRNDEACTKFNHILTSQLNFLKNSLIAEIETFEKNILKKDTVFRSKLDKEKRMACKEALHQTVEMIKSAKTVSAIVATIAIEADLFAQMGLSKDVSKTDNLQEVCKLNFHAVASSMGVHSIAGLFSKKLPEVLTKWLQKIAPQEQLNTTGSAFQLEHARESLMLKLENYLNSRGKENLTTTSHNEITRTYEVEDKGIFFNKTLQEERLKVAAKLYMQLQLMQVDRDGKNSNLGMIAIDSPFGFRNLLIKAMNENNTCYEEHGRWLVDGVGELAGILNEAHSEMSKIYTQEVKLHGHNLHELLEQDRQPPGQTSVNALSS